jgi:hypothetical protein
MTAHQLAKYLLACPDVPVDINGVGSDEGISYEVTGAALVGPDENVGGYKFDQSYKGDRLFLGHGDYDWETGKMLSDWCLRASRLEVSQ